MLTELASVLGVDANGVRVETVRQSACSSCRSKAGCGQKLLAELGQGQRFEVVASNPLQLMLQPGDSVELGIEEASFLRASLMVYLLPLFALILAAIVADQLGVAESMVVASAGLGLLSGFALVRWWGARDRQRCRYQPQILGLKNS